MASNLMLGKASGGVLNITPTDGITSTSIVLPLSGTVATTTDVSGALVNAALTGTPTAPTPSAGDNSTKLATTAYVDGKMVRATAVNSTSGTSIDFTGIPSWAKRITVMFSGVSTNGASNYQIQIGAGSITTSGYMGSMTLLGGSTVVTTNIATGFGVHQNSAGTAFICSGTMELTLINSNIWVAYGSFARTDANNMLVNAGSIGLGATLDRIRITTVNGTDTFDAGQINIMYEG